MSNDKTTAEKLRLVRTPSKASGTLEDMRNLGAATARMLLDVDIGSQDMLRELGAVAAYQRLKFHFGGAVTLVALYALEGALRGEDWRSLDPEIKRGLIDQVHASEQTRRR